MTDGVIIGIDAGTSKIKTSLFTMQGTLLRESSADVTLMYPAHDRAEIDVEVMFANLFKLLRDLVVGYEKEVKAIGFSVASPTLILFGHGLQAVRPGIVYLDNRSITQVEKAVEKFGGPDKYFERVGNNPSPSTCVAATLNWLQENEPENWAQTYKIGFLNTYLAAQLTGKIAVDPTVASYSGLMDVRKPDGWDMELVELFGINPEVLPEVVPSYSKMGELDKSMADALKLPTGISVALGGADTAVTSFALGLQKHGDTFQSMGTSEVITFCLDNPKFSPAFMNRSHVIPGLWLSHGAMSTAGGAIGWLLKSMFTEFKSEMELEELATQSPYGSNGIVFLPYLCGERSPIFDPRASGVFFGLNITTNKADTVRSVYEGVAYGMQQIFNIGSAKWGIKPEFIKCVGGASKSAMAVQLRADALATEIRTIESDCTASYGAALLGAIAAGIFTLDQVPYLTAYGKVVKPNTEGVAHFSKYQEIYNKIYPNLKDLMQLHYSFTNVEAK